MRKPLAVLALSAGIVLAGTTTAPPAHGASVELEPVLVTQVEGLVVIAADGSVAELGLATPVPGELGPALESRLRALRFVPVTIGGKPVRAKTAFILALSAREKAEGGLSVSVDGIEFRAPKGAPLEHADGERASITGRMMTPPRIPADLLRTGVPGGGVDVAVCFKADGTVEDAAIVRSYLMGSKNGGPAARKFMRAFDAVALAAARQWRADVPADGAPRSAAERTTTVLVTYSSGSSPMPYERKGTWVPVLRSPKRPAPWLAGDAAEADRIATAGGSTASGAFRLVSPLAGTPVM